MIRFATGVKVSAVSESHSPFSSAMSSIFLQNISLRLDRIIQLHVAVIPPYTFPLIVYSFEIII